jgi:hypothetical protein
MKNNSIYASTNIAKMTIDNGLFNIASKKHELLKENMRQSHALYLKEIGRNKQNAGTSR